MIHRISNCIAVKISDALNLEKERRDIIAYGAFGILQFLWSVVLVAILSAFLGVFTEAMIISFSAAILRKSSGGAHATSPGRCAVIGMLVFTVLALAVEFIYRDAAFLFCIVYSATCIITAYITVYRHAPVDTPNKPITGKETIKKLRRASFVTIHIFLAVMAVLTTAQQIYANSLVIKSILLSVGAGILWQAITLTSPGHYIINNMDMLMGKISIKLGGENV